MEEQFSIVGRAIPRNDGVEKAVGEAKYLDDIDFPGLLHGRILRSPYPHARIVQINTRRAESLPGVQAVITGQDVPDIKFSFVQELADKYILCKDKVRYAGDEVAAVCAVNPETANRALSLIEVTYEELPAVFDPHEALQENAPRIHGGSNLAFEVHKQFGDVHIGFAESDYTRRDEFRTSATAHCCLEPRGCIAYYSRGGRLTLWTPVQAPHTVRQEISRILGIPAAQVRIIQPMIGGAFGSRLVIDMKEPIAALLSKISGHPVKIVNSRKEEFETAKLRYPCLISVKTGVRRNGRIVAREIEMIVDNGAYNDKGPGIINAALLFSSALYNVPHFKFDGYLVNTNKEFGTAFRGFGNPQIHFATESQLDMIAEKLGIDPLEIRLINSNRPGDRTASGAHIVSCGLEDCIRSAGRQVDWAVQKRDKAAEPEEKKKRGLGMAAMLHGGGGGRKYGYSANDAFMKMSEDGLITLITSAVEIGQGAKTVMAQIAAEELGARYEDIVVLGDDTDLTSFDLGAFGSRSTYVCGNAARDCAKKMKSEVLGVAARMLESRPEELVVGLGEIRVKGSPGSCISFSDVAGFAVRKMGRPISARGRFSDPLAVGIEQRKFGEAMPAFSFACQVAEVEVDEETGEIRLLQMTAAHDSGTPINLLGAEGQIEGGIAQALGYTLMEDMVFERGVLLNPSFADYKIPTAMDVPPIKNLLIQTEEPTGPFGAKGIAEPGLVATAPAIANAIYDATGIRFTEIPITPEKVLAAVKRRRESTGR